MLLDFVFLCAKALALAFFAELGGVGGQDSGIGDCWDAEFSCEERLAAGEQHAAAGIGGSSDGCIGDVDAGLFAASILVP